MCGTPGFEGPVAVIPHGAWIPEADRLGYRDRLGIDPDTPLIGVFGFLKPYKRIAESLRAFRRLLRVQPNARMILVGEPHPDFPLQSLIDGLGLHPSVRSPGLHADRGLCRLHSRVRHHSQSALSDRGRKFGYAAALAGPRHAP